MERFVKGDVVVLPFPYTDFSRVKKRHPSSHSYQKFYASHLPCRLGSSSPGFAQSSTSLFQSAHFQGRKLRPFCGSAAGCWAHICRRRSISRRILSNCGNPFPLLRPVHAQMQVPSRSFPRRECVAGHPPQ